jgi:hypothetical protein
MSLTRKDIHQNLYFAGLLLLAAAIPLSHFVMSIAQMLLLGNWLAEGSLKEKLSRFLRNKPALVFSLIYLLHILGLIYTTDFDYAVKDLRTKVPLLLLPLIISTSSPLSAQRRLGLIVFYILAVVSGSLVITTLYFTRDVSNLREIFPFISHIRFSLNVVLAIVFMVWLAHEPRSLSKLPAWLYGVLIAGLGIFLFITQSMTGLGILLVLAFVSVLILIPRQLNAKRKWILSALLLGLLAGPLVFLYGHYREAVKKNPTDFKTLDSATMAGNPYFHDTTARQYVNGNPMWIYICEPELRSVWNRRSSCDFDGQGITGYGIKDVLIRFMTSKGIRKDSIGLMSLTNNELSYIERGCADARNINSNSLSIRVREILWEYQNYKLSRNASGFSLMLRLEYWKASLALIREHPLAGVGTGDMNLAFQSYYEKTNSLLGPEWRHRSHNQFLSVTVGFGIFGLIVFLFALFYPPWKSGQLKPGLFFYFLMILLLSMMTEDTIETQAGVTFAAFFYVFLLFIPEEKAYL